MTFHVIQNDENRQGRKEMTDDYNEFKRKYRKHPVFLAMAERQRAESLWMPRDLGDEVTEEIMSTTVRDRISYHRAANIVRRASTRSWCGWILARIGLIITKDVREEIQMQES